MSFNTVTVGTTATKIVDANSRRQSLLIENEGGVTVFLGPNNTVTKDIGIGLKQGDGKWKTFTQNMKN